MDGKTYGGLRFLLNILALLPGSKSRHCGAIQRRPQPKSAEAGLTLLELLVVIIIVGILAAIAYPAFLNMRVRAQYAEAKLKLDEMRDHLTEQALFDGGTYPRDVRRNQLPPGYDQTWYLAADMPFSSSTDYEHWSLGNDRCLVAITWYGQNQVREYPAHTLPPTSGQSDAIGDDVVITVNEYDCPGVPRGAV